MTGRKIWLMAAALTVGLLGLTLPVLSADDPKDAPPAEEAPNDVLDVAATAYKTADFGRDHDSPESLLAAAVMLHSLKFAKTTPITEQPTDEDGKAIDEKELGSKSFDDEADELFDEAASKALEMKIPGFDAIIKAAKSRETRGLRGGAKTVRRKIGPGKSQVFHFKFVVGKNAPFCFDASKPLFLEVVNHDTGDVWEKGVFQHYHNNNPAHVGNRKPKAKEAHVTFTIRNHDKKPVEYKLFIQ